MLKKLMIGAALAAMMGAPAMAQSWNPSVGSGNIVGPYARAGQAPIIPRHGYAFGEYNAYGHAHAYMRGYGHRWDHE